MILDIKKADKDSKFDIYSETLPNGGSAVLDDDGKLIAYSRVGSVTGNHNDWDWVRKDFQK